MKDRDFLLRLLAWHKRWPKSVFYMNQENIRTSECEMDDIMVDAEEFLKSEGVKLPNIVASPDLTGFAPAHMQWMAYDNDRYDGAEDAGHQCVGYGVTKEEAIADYHEHIRDNH